MSVFSNVGSLDKICFKITQGKLFKVVALSSLSVAMLACTQTNPARVQDISNSPSQVVSSTRTVSVTSSGSSDNYNQRPANIVTTNNAATRTSAPATDNTTTTTTTTTQERIVYTRNYDDIPKGGYKDDSYTVQRGDTLFYVAWITGNDFRALALKNNIKEPYDLSVGQVLNVGGDTTILITEKTTSVPVTKPTNTTNSTKPTTKPNTTTTTTVTTQTASNVANIRWSWPAKGKIIERFSNATKGIDIAGALGDKVLSAAAGRVVYAGNALPGYGNLIIVKHNEDYLTAYAHNQTILVKEQQDIAAGQQIATMGNTGTSSVRLHFEIRYKAKSVDPMKYLPKQ